MVKKLSDLVNTALNTCFFSLGIKLICLAAKKNINKAEGSPELNENWKNLFKGVQYKPKNSCRRRILNADGTIFYCK